MSLLAFLLTLVTAVSVLLAIKYFRIAQQADPSRMQGLLVELNDLKAAYRSLENEAAEAKLKASSNATSPAPAVSSPVAAAAPQIAPQEAPEVPATPILAPPTSGTSLVFSALPAEIHPGPADASQIPIRIQSIKVQQVGKKIHVNFNILYVKEDGGSQQGRILMLARGPDGLVTYPVGALNPTGSASLLAVNKGEYFSVSRFREVKAEFGPIVQSQALKDVEVLIISQKGELLYHEKLTPTPPTAAAARPALRKAAPPDAPAAPTTESAPAGSLPKTEAAPAPLAGPQSAPQENGQ